MMGHGYYGNRQRGEFHEEKFAWWPVYSTFNKKRIWLSKYTVIHVLHDEMGRPPIKGYSWPLIYTKNEYLVHMIKDNDIV